MQRGFSSRLGLYEAISLDMDNEIMYKKAWYVLIFPSQQMCGGMVARGPSYLRNMLWIVLSHFLPAETSLCKLSKRMYQNLGVPIRETAELIPQAWS